MGFNDIKQKIGRYLINLQGWSTKRKIVVIESDDWGSIRMPSREVYEKCLSAGYPVDKISYERYDSLASEDDLELLFELLTSFKDKYGNHPVITANCAVANPDFEKIRSDSFQDYHYELITDTFKRYPKHKNNFCLWQQGMTNRIFYPQYHCREHLNVNLFMEALRKEDKDALFGFENQMPGSIPKGPVLAGNLYVESTNFETLKEKEDTLSIFLEGLDIFEELFGYRSVSIIPPNYTWSHDFNRSVFEKGVKYFQGFNKIREPIPGGLPEYHKFTLGTRNTFGQIYLLRNVLFEPSMFRLGINDPVGRCLSDMEIAFRMHKPSVISSHRINYVGFTDQTNRDRTLKMLDQVFISALNRWPDIEFMTSVQLGRLIMSGN